jgi:hypothetical protein
MSMQRSRSGATTSPTRSTRPCPLGAVADSREWTARRNHDALLMPYVGMAKVFDLVHATNDVLTERGGEQHIQRYLSGSCFGDQVARDGLDVRTRELLTFAMLVSRDGCEPQVKGHIGGNLRVGNDR